MAQDDLYDLSPGPHPPKPAPALPPRKLNYESAPVKKDADLKEHRLIHLHLPLILLTAGVIVESVAAIIRTRGAPGAMSLAMRSLSLHLVLGTAVMLAGVWIAARIRKIEFGSFPLAVLKLAAVAVAPQAVVTILHPTFSFLPGGFLLAFVTQFLLAFALLGAMFDMDESDTWYCLAVIFILSVALRLGLMWLG